MQTIFSFKCKKHNPATENNPNFSQREKPQFLNWS